MIAVAKISKRVLVLLLLVGLHHEAHAAVSPVAISIAPPVQFPPADFDVTGLRASVLWGHHRAFYGVDLGVLGNITDQDFVGISVAGLFNDTRGTTTTILQLAGGANVNTSKTTVVGLQAAILSNYNSAESSVWGLQLAAANISPHTTINGFQVGVVNSANVVHGFQIGLVNMTETLRGIQIGLINFNHTGMFEYSPVLNIGF